MTANADRGLRAERAAEIIVGPADGGAGAGRRGSGYLVSPGRVLTAAHVVEGTEAVRVRFEADRPGERTVEAAVEWRHAGVDVAVLTLAGDVGADVPSVSFGRVGEQDAVMRCTALGFPRFKLRTDEEDGSRFRDAEHMDATCAVLSNRREGTLDLKVTSPPEDDPDPERDAWEGMSGAAVFSNGHLVGIVTRHHRTDGTGRIAASRVDRWAEALPVTQLTELERAVGRTLTPTALPDALPASDLDLVQELYRAQLADIAPGELLGRQAEFNELVAFCGGPDDYLWLQGPPWAGKTALAATFALNPPRGVVPVWFFITARYASQSDSNAYTGALIDQLAVIAGREPTGNSSVTARDGERRLLLRQAAERVARDGGTLLLVVDGLDEDQSRVTGGSGTSIASLLPAKLPPNVRVLVTSRPNPGLPSDVGGGHPLRHCRVVKLSPAAAARHTEYEAGFDLEHALSGDKLQRDLVGLLTAARGTLTVEDLRELTGEPPYELNRRLGSAFGRILRLRGSGFESSQDRDVSLYMSSRGYLFAHETLLAAAQEALGPDVDTYLRRLHAWAESYANRGWPEGTPPYLLQPYGRLLTFVGDAHRAVVLATDVRRRDRMREVTGSDAACLAEIAAARHVVRRAASDDLGALAALAAAEDLVTRRNDGLHPDIPAVYARLGRVRHAIGLARSVFRPADRGTALAGVARVLAETGDRRAVTLAEEALGLTVAKADGGGFLDDSYLDVLVAQGALATALAATGRGTEAVDHFRELPVQPTDPGRTAAVRELVMAARAARDPACAADLLRLAEQFTEKIECLSERVRALGSVAQAWAARREPGLAARLYDSVVAVARQHADDPENVPAAAIEVLRPVRPDDADRVARLAMKHMDGGRVSWSRAYGAARALVATGQVADAQAFMKSLPEADRLGRARLWRGTWWAIAEGWAREGRAAEAWAALETSWDPLMLYDARDRSVAGVAGLLAEGGGADALETLLLTAVSPPRAAAEGLAALALHFVPDDPDRAVRLLHEAEHGRHAPGGRLHPAQDEHLAVLAGSLAWAERPGEAERLVQAISDPMVRAWGYASVSVAVARRDAPMALRLAERAAEVSSPADDMDPGSPARMATVQALACAGVVRRTEEVISCIPGGDSLWSVDYRSRARMVAVAGLWPHTPELAGQWADDLLADKRDGSVADLARLFVAVGSHDRERAARVLECLRAQDAGHLAPRSEYSEVLLSLLAATTDPVAARRRLDRVVSAESRTLPGLRPEAAVTYAALGDYEKARATIEGGAEGEDRSEALAYLAAYVACVPSDSMGGLPRGAHRLTPPTVLSLAASLLPLASGPDLPRARALLADALTPDGWHHAMPVLAEVDRDAVLRVRDVVFAHLGLSMIRAEGD